MIRATTEAEAHLLAVDDDITVKVSVVESVPQKPPGVADAAVPSTRTVA